MSALKLNLAMLCAYMGMNTRDLAKAAGISETHLVNVRAGRTALTADDLLGLSNATGIPMQNIEI